MEKMFRYFEYDRKDENLDSSGVEHLEDVVARACSVTTFGGRKADVRIEEDKDGVKAIRVTDEAGQVYLIANREEIPRRPFCSDREILSAVGQGPGAVSRLVRRRIRQNS